MRERVVDVGIVGGSGYGGAELLRLLAGHPVLKVRTVAAKSNAGRDLAEVFPHLGMTGTLAPSEPEALAGCDVVFLATPHAASLELAPALLDQGALVVDLSGAFRLDAATFTEWYGLPHTAPELAPGTYGLPELWRGDLAGARLIANPGCYPTAALLALCPLGGVAEPTGVVIAGMSGTSGAGKGLRDDLHVSHAVANVSPYAAPRHRHTPEIEAGWARAAGQRAAVTFTPHLVPMARGLLATLSARPAPGTTPEDIRAAFDDAYRHEPFVTVLPEGSWPATAHVSGGNAAHVGVASDPRTGRVTVACAIDNLVKGAAGQAIQNANVALGLSEAAGLSAAGVYP
ncbi:MAG: N-acetyl-gamma-glutamyl-phosphate reductase [Egibacteraceae bacterium]